MKEELEKILLKAGVPKGIHRVKLDTEIVADRYSPENINKISTTDTFTEALTSIINLVDKEVIGKDLPLDQLLDHNYDEITLAAWQIFRKGANWEKECQRAKLKGVSK